MMTVPFANIRGSYRPVYRAQEINHCPGCGNTQWMVGRITAECAFCATALPLNDGGMIGGGMWRAHPRAFETTLAA